MGAMRSEMRSICSVTFPAFSGLRIMMMPIDLGAPHTVPGGYRSMVAASTNLRSGVAYLTVDERDVPAGQTHRRPGRHVDGCGA